MADTLGKLTKPNTASPPAGQSASTGNSTKKKLATRRAKRVVKK